MLTKYKTSEIQSASKISYNIKNSEKKLEHVIIKIAISTNEIKKNSLSVVPKVTDNGR